MNTNCTLKIVSAKDYEKIADKYPEKVKNRIKGSKGFADKNNGVAFVKSRRNKADMAGVALHEVMELIATVSPHDEQGIRCKGETIQYQQPPAPTYSESPQSQEFFEEYWRPVGIPKAKEEYEMWQEYAKPYAEMSFDRFKSEESLYKDVFEPTSRQVGGYLGEQLGKETEYPEFQQKDWDNIWRSTQEKTRSAFAPMKLKASERFAGGGALESSGQVEKALREIETQEAKTLEDQAFEQSLAEFEEIQQYEYGKYGAEQTEQAKQIENMFRYLGYTPAGGGAGAWGATQNIPYVGMDATAAQGYIPERPWYEDFAVEFGGGLGEGVGESLGKSSERYKKNIKTWKR